MNDGLKIVLRDTKVTNIYTEDELYSSLDFIQTNQYTFLSSFDEVVEIGLTYVYEGYDDRFPYNWKKISFGEWIKDYGLSPDCIYYCCTLEYCLYLPLLSNGEYVPIFPLDNMGFSSSMINHKSFDVIYNRNYPKEILATYFLFIAYDEDRNPVSIELPIKQNITWHFTVKS